MVQAPFARARAGACALLSLSLSLAVAAVACSSSDGGPQPMMCLGANVVAKEVNDYAFSSTITLPPVTAKSMSNLTFAWDKVSIDFLQHPLKATTDINSVSVLLWQLPLADLESKLNADTLTQMDLVVVPPPSWPAPGATTGGATQAKLYDFTVNGTPIAASDFNAFFDPAMYPPAQYSYMVAASTGTTIGQGFRMIQSFNLDAAATSTTVALTNASTKLTYHANLHALTITGVPGGTPNLKLDSGQMKTNAMGAEFTQGVITSAIVGHYNETPAQLETKFLDLATIATNYYRANIDSGSVLDFATLKDSNGAPFPGIDDKGTWLVGLICGNCRNPAPWYMTILKPCTP